MSLFFHRKILIILSFTQVCVAFGLGTWMKELSPLTPFVPDFIILKVGVFSNNGALKGLKGKEQLAEGCKNVALTAWVTHRLSKNETLSESAGKRLGGEIRQLLEGTCVKTVELDIEPVPEAYDWYVKFARATKAALGEVSLRFAVPAEFSPESFKKLFSAIDGIDWMLYDTGLDDAGKYTDLLVQSFEFAESVQTVTLGIPAYYDKSKLHKSNVESLKSVIQALSKFTPKNKKAWCDRKLDFALYAGWTLTSQDKALSQLIRAWRESLCKTGS